MSAPFYTDTLLLEQLAAGNVSAFNTIYDRFSGTLYNAIMIYVRNEQEADDLLQTAFVRIWEKRTLMATVQNLESYIFVLTRNIVMNHLKKQAYDGRWRLHYERSLSPAAGSTENHLAENEYRSLWQQAINILPVQQKKVYLLAEEEGLSYEEIAGRLDLSRLTVKKHLELARKQVRLYVNQRLHGFVVLPILVVGGHLF